MTMFHHCVVFIYCEVLHRHSPVQLSFFSSLGIFVILIWKRCLHSVCGFDRKESMKVARWAVLQWGAIHTLGGWCYNGGAIHTRCMVLQWGSYTLGGRCYNGEHTQTRWMVLQWGSHTQTRLAVLQWGSHTQTRLAVLQWGSHTQTRWAVLQWGSIH